MVDSEVSGVAFSRHPLSPLSKEVALVEAVLGLGEGLVSGELVADQYEVRLTGTDTIHFRPSSLTPFLTLHTSHTLYILTPSHPHILPSTLSHPHTTMHILLLPLVSSHPPLHTLTPSHPHSHPHIIITSLPPLTPHTLFTFPPHPHNLTPSHPLYFPCTLTPSQVSRKERRVVRVEVAEKAEMFVQGEEGGVRRVGVAASLQKERALGDEQAAAIAILLWAVEEALGRPQDFEWAIQAGEHPCSS